MPFDTVSMRVDVKENLKKYQKKNKLNSISDAIQSLLDKVEGIKGGGN